MKRSMYVALPLLLVLTVIQSSFLAHFGGQIGPPQLAVVVVISWAVLRGGYEGALWAFIAGLFLDLFSFAPLGTTSLALMVAVLIIVRLKQHLPENPYVIPLLLTTVAFSLYLVLDLLILRVAGYSIGWSILSHLPLLTLLHVLLALPTFWLLYTLERMLYPRALEG
ncbi:MAG: rod shape-determining protein MreD [Candidatus Promineifilaceae bacterium]|nr:rod shape-determining protein MreD [Candidatus Promineifilaceae bacterium]